MIARNGRLVLASKGEDPKDIPEVLLADWHVEGERELLYNLIYQLGLEESKSIDCN